MISACMKKAFTLIELLVAVAILALMVAFASMILEVSIDSYRTSAATAEIMQKLRAITDQLNNDFRGLRKDAPLLIWFQQSAADANRYDQIMFFADGDFSSVQLYKDETNGKPDPVDGTKVIRGDVARIYYGQAKVNNVDPWDQTGRDERRRVLACRQHILTADTNVDDWPLFSMTDFGTVYDGYKKNERYEHDRLSLAQWKIVESSKYEGSTSIIELCFNQRSPINLSDPKTLHKLLCQGVGNLAIQWAYWDDKDGKGRFSWFPGTDPYGSGGTADSQFNLMGKDKFGVYFNIDGDITDWFAVRNGNIDYRGGHQFAADFFPAALKFTFRLYDSKGVIKDGMPFTHIVYLEK